MVGIAAVTLACLMSINRPPALPRFVQSSGGVVRGANGLYTPTLSGTINPFPDVLQGLDDGKLWGNVQLVNGVLCGTTISPSPPYDDSIMLVPGLWGDNITITATIVRTGNALAATSQEVELLVCGEIGPYWARFYEVQLSVHGSTTYANIVRWNGGGGNVIANYTELALVTGTPVVANGDTFRARKVGNTIFCELDQGSGFSTLTSTDITAAAANPYGPNVYKRGLVGSGYFQQGGSLGNLPDFGLKDLQFSAP